MKAASPDEPSMTPMVGDRFGFNPLPRETLSQDAPFTTALLSPARGGLTTAGLSPLTHQAAASPEQVMSTPCRGRCVEQIPQESQCHWEEQTQFQPNIPAHVSRTTAQGACMQR